MLLRSSGFLTRKALSEIIPSILSVYLAINRRVADMMRKECKCEELSDGKRYITILLDEMKIIVYDKTTWDVVGFCNLCN